jgi:MFS family permease
MQRSRPMRKSLSPLRLPGFRQLASVYTINELGNWVGEIALAVLVYDETGSPLATAGLFLGMVFLPSLIGQGVIARLEVIGTRTVLPFLFLGEAVAFVALAATADNFALALVIALAIVDGTLAIAARTFARASAAAVLTPSGELREGNAIINVGFTVASAAGPALAGIVVAALGVQTALLIDAASFVVVAAALALSRAIPQVKGEPQAWAGRLREGLAYVRSRKVLFRLLSMQALAFVFFTLVLPIEIVYAKETLDAGDSGYGALLSSWGAGMVVGSIVFVAAARSVSLPLQLAASTAMIGCAYLGMAGAQSIVAACAAAAVGGIGNGVQWVALMSAVQELTASRYQARVVGLLESIGRVMPGVGFILGGAIAALVDPRASFVAAGAGALTVLVLAVLLLRDTDWTPEAEPHIAAEGAVADAPSLS